MPPKKREKEADNAKNPRIDHIQADHELFLQAFEKPTQIYRYLRTRSMCSPIFLHRTLTYMRYRMSRSHKNRQGFKADSLLDRVQKKQDQSGSIQPGYINITFLGFTDKNLEKNAATIVPQAAQVETVLLKINHKKRKESSASSMQVTLGTAEIPVNPDDRPLPPKTAPTISISTQTFHSSGGPLAKSYIFLFRVKINEPNTANNCTETNATNPENKFECRKIDDAIDDEENNKNNDDKCAEPPLKKRKPSSNLNSNNNSSLNNHNLNPSSSPQTLCKIYGAELTVYDKHNRCYLADGDYDVLLQDFTGDLTRNSPKKHASWECGNDIIEATSTTNTTNNITTTTTTTTTTDLSSNDNGGNSLNLMFKEGAVLRFKLQWSLEACAHIVDRPSTTYPRHENKENIPATITAKPNENKTNNNAENGVINNSNNVVLKEKEKLQIVYQFVYNNNSRQQTEACEDLHCPWCSINSDQLYTLLKHLKLSHSRFTFTYVPISVGARIDVAINELYDGSYSGSPHDLISQPPKQANNACAFSRNGPVRRASVTHILVCHPKRITKPSLSEFLELDECEYDGQRPFITGHNRLYHHTNTCLPIYPKEMDVDSEGENDPEWLRNKTMMLMDEFSDVNEGEKELMKMWNLHMMKYGFVGICQIPLACQIFVQQRGRELLMNNLYKNFVLHMGSLFDFGLISAVCLYTTIQRLQDMMADETGTIPKILKESRDAQIDNWPNKNGGNNEEKPSVPTSTSPSTINRCSTSGTGAPTTVNSQKIESPVRRKSVMVCLGGGDAVAEVVGKKRLSLSLIKDQKISQSKDI